MENKALLILFVLLFISCNKSDEISLLCNDEQVNIDPNQMDFCNLKTGQKFRYILLVANGYYSQDSTNFIYTGDTLELEILDYDNEKYLISEKISPWSNMMINSDEYYWNVKDSVYSNYWLIRNDSLVIESKHAYVRSHLMFIFLPKLSLKEFDGEEVQITGWKTSFPYTESNHELFTKNYTLLGENYERLNIHINNSFMQADGPGYTTIFSKEYGIVRTSTYSWWTGEGIGWDKL